MSRLSRLLRTALHPMLLLGTGVALAQPPPPRHAPPSRQEPAQQREHGDRGGRSDRGLPASVRRVERQTGGEVLRAEPMQRDGREVYRLKVLTADGRIRVVQDDPGRPRDSRRAGAKDKGNRQRDSDSNKQDDTSRDSDEQPPQ